MGVIIEESGLRFGEYYEDQVFQIETSPQYTKSLRDNGIKSCEFILRKGKKLYFFEAKSSCPRQIMKDIPDNVYLSSVNIPGTHDSGTASVFQDDVAPMENL